MRGTRCFFNSRVSRREISRENPEKEKATLSRKELERDQEGWGKESVPQERHRSKVSSLGGWWGFFGFGVFLGVFCWVGGVFWGGF